MMNQYLLLILSARSFCFLNFLFIYPKVDSIITIF
ncbi:unnamed protein product [Brassica oleracea var. botrytis]